MKQNKNSTTTTEWNMKHVESDIPRGGFWDE